MLKPETESEKVQLRITEKITGSRLDSDCIGLKGCVNAIVECCDIAESVTNVNKNIESENFCYRPRIPVGVFVVKSYLKLRPITKHGNIGCFYNNLLFYLENFCITPNNSDLFLDYQKVLIIKSQKNKNSKEITKEMADQPELLLEAEASDLGTKE